MTNFGGIPAPAESRRQYLDFITQENFRFPGQYFDDETGLHYNRFRYYDPEVGRYLRVDPIGLKSGVNIFSYALNNPNSYFDPLGLDDCVTLEDGTVRCKMPPTPPDEKGQPDPSSDILDFSMGAEAHFIKGYGRDTFYCCDAGGNHWRVRTEKVCKGYSAVISGGGVIIKLNQSDCPDGFEGEYLELGSGMLEATLPESGTNGLALGVSAGWGAKFTICKYTILEKEIVGCCE